MIKNSSKEQIIARANELKNRMINSGLANPAKIQGCSKGEEEAKKIRGCL